MEKRPRQFKKIVLPSPEREEPVDYRMSATPAHPVAPVPLQAVIDFTANDGKGSITLPSRELSFDLLFELYSAIISSRHGT